MGQNDDKRQKWTKRGVSGARRATGKRPAAQRFRPERPCKTQNQYPSLRKRFFQTICRAWFLQAFLSRFSCDVEHTPKQISTHEGHRHGFRTPIHDHRSNAASPGLEWEQHCVYPYIMTFLQSAKSAHSTESSLV